MKKTFTPFLSMGVLVFFAGLLVNTLSNLVHPDRTSVVRQEQSLPAATIVINEILYDPAPGVEGDANGDGTRNASDDEFVEIVNASASAIDISGWTLHDNVALRHVFGPNTILSAQCGIVVFGGGIPPERIGEMPIVIASTGLLGLNNGGDMVELRDENGDLQQSVSYTNTSGGSDQSITLSPDLTGTYVPHSTVADANGALFSPGTMTDGTAFAGCDEAVLPFMASFSTDTYLCFGENVTLTFAYQGGVAPYSFTYEGLVYSTDDNTGTVEIPLPAEAQIDMPNDLILTAIQDNNGGTMLDFILQVTPINCAEPINNFFAEDPCTCNNDQSANGAQDGSFTETVSIGGTTAEQVWSIVSIKQVSGGTGLEPVKLPPVGNAVAITEFMGNVAGNENTLEFVELFNYGNDAVDLAGFTLSDEGSDELTLPAYTLNSGAYAIIVKENAKAAFEAEWFNGVSQNNVLQGTGPFTIGNGSDELILRDNEGNLLWQLNYRNDESEGRATFHTSTDLSLTPMVYLDVRRNGIDNSTPGFLGYEENDTATDPSAFASPGAEDNFGSPGLGNYTVVNDKNMPIQMGTRLIFDPVNDRHYLSFLHFDDAGYEIVIEGPNAVGAPNNTSFTLSNVCQYPSVAFDPGISQGFPQNAVPLVFSLSDENGLPEDPDQPAFFEVDGITQTQITPIDRLPGTYSVFGAFKADATGNQNGTLAMPANPGCETTIQEPLTIRNTLLTTDSCTCYDNILVTLDNNCGYELKLDQVVSTGDCTGMGVLVGDTNPDNGAMIDCPGTFEYVVYDGANQQLCWGTVTAEDKSGPVPIDTILPSQGAITDIDCAQVDNILNQELSTEPFFTDFFGRVLVNNFSYVGKIVFEDGCVECACEVTTSFTDKVEYYTCETVQDDDGRIGRTVGKLVRTWTAEDCNGHRSKATQEFRIYLPDLDDLFDLPDKEFQTCDAENFDVPGPDIPFWTSVFAGNVTFLSQTNCGYSYNVEEGGRFPICDGKGYKFTRIYTVLDWCTGESAPIDTVLVKVGDFEAPVFDDCALVSGDALANGAKFTLDAVTMSKLDTLLSVLRNFAGPGIPISQSAIDTISSVCVYPTISTGPMNCTAGIPTTLQGLRDRFGSNLVEDCNDPQLNLEIFSYLPVTVGGIPTGDTTWVRGSYEQRNNMITGIPEGFHALAITATDDCYSSELGVIFFTVQDLVKPVMKCDDELRVTLVEGDEKLGINGYALVTYQDVDEGSWDNCELVSLEVRREIIDADARADWEAKNGALDEDEDYTPWGDLVEFFCGDLGVPVEVQLQGTDRKGNQSICWLDVEVENGTNYAVDISGGGAITCEDEFVAEDWYTLSTVGLGCFDADIQVDVDTFLDQCGFGYYEISIADNNTEATKNASYIDDEVIIVNVVPVHDYWIKFPADDAYFCADEAAAGVEVSEEVACDLLTIYENDERFESVADPDACYKIFRTYKVINWCEYDGESLPVVVSRDWDAHNGEDDGDEFQEYNLNPAFPDGDNIAGNTDMYVIVAVNYLTDAGIVYYDNTSDPDDGSTAGLTDDNNTTVAEGYWWAVTAGTGFDDASFNNYAWYDYEGVLGGVNPIGNAPTGNDLYDIAGTDAQDDDDTRYGSFGYWQYTQHIVVYDDTAPTAEIEVDAKKCTIASDCLGDVDFTITVDDACSTEGISVSAVLNGAVALDLIDNGDGTYAGTITDGPLGQHTITATVNDGCGNITMVSAALEIVDCKAPAPICHEDMVVELMPVEGEANAAMAEIWASDLIASDIGDCSGQGPGLINGLPKVSRYSINRLDSVVSVDQTGLIFDCDDSNDIISVEVHAWDERDNHDYCVVNIFVQNNNLICGFDIASGLIAGAINTEIAEPVEGVEVGLSGSTSMIYQTDISGEYGFENLLAGYDYSIIPQKDQDHRKGISTFDLILIQQHILGESQLDSPYKLIAADVNNSKSVTTLDLIQLRKLILNIDTEFANNTSWRFVDADYRFPNPQNPWERNFPEVKNINNLERANHANFVAIKVGDVNASALVEARAAKGSFAIQTTEQEMIAGNEYTIDFSADRSDIAGYQFTLNVDYAEIVDITYGAAKAENFAVFSKEGIITTSFNGQASGTLFSLVLRATADVKVSEAIQLSSRYTAAEAYTNAGAQLSVALHAALDGTKAAAFALRQNAPNPFDGETVIGFNLPVAQEATISLQDIAGRTVKLVEGDFAKGYNQITISANDFPSAGVYFYTLRAGDQSATKKLILVEVLNR